MVNHIALMALDGLLLRHQVTSHNLANLNSEGFRPLRVDFESMLQNLSPNEASNFAPLTYQENNNNGLKSNLSHEISLLTETNLRYQSLIKGLNKYYGLLQLAVTEGRR